MARSEWIRNGQVPAANPSCKDSNIALKLQKQFMGFSGIKDLEFTKVLQTYKKRENKRETTGREVERFRFESYLHISYLSIFFASRSFKKRNPG